MTRVLDGTSWYSHGHTWAILEHNEEVGCVWRGGRRWIKVTELLREKAGIWTQACLLQCLHSVPYITEDLPEYFPPRQYRWLTSPSNNCLRKETPMWNGNSANPYWSSLKGPGAFSGKDLQFMSAFCYLFSICLTSFCSSIPPLLPSFALSGSFLVYHFNFLVDFNCFLDYFP